MVVAASCGKQDSAADTDQAGQDLRKAQASVSEQRKSVEANEAAIEGKKRELIKGQQELADTTKSLEDHRQQLGSAGTTLVQARTAYSAAVIERLARADAALAGLATQTDAQSTDAVAGLRARRALLAAKLSTMPVAADPAWAGFTHDVDAVFDAIEHDLQAAKH
jgi:predicted  nucleic acid-binding Zn-ribbon protein